MKPLHPTSWRLARALLLGLAFAGTAACENLDTAAPPTEAAAADAPTPDAADARTGALSFELKTQGDLTFNTFSYVITGPKNVVRSGTIDVSHSTAVSMLVNDLPAQAGYSITLSGTSAAPDKADCSGSAAFDISARVVTNVPVAVQCHVQPQAVVTPPTTGAAAPIPPFVGWLLGFSLLALGLVRRPRSPVS